MISALGDGVFLTNARDLLFVHDVVELLEELLVFFLGRLRRPAAVGELPVTSYLYELYFGSARRAPPLNTPPKSCS
jgi:hypothetical protein